MRCGVNLGQLEDSGKWPCSVCQKGVGRNSICCEFCKKWVHKRCSGVKDKLQAVVEFQCPRCRLGDQGMTNERRDIMVDGNSALECVDRFCYLGDMIGAGGM